MRTMLLSYRRAEVLADYLRDETHRVWTLSIQVEGDSVTPVVSDGSYVIRWWDSGADEETYYADAGAASGVAPRVYSVEGGLFR